MGERDRPLWSSDSLVSNLAKTRSQCSLLRHSPQDPQVHRVYGWSRGSALFRSAVMDTSVRVCFCRTSTTPFQTLSDISNSGTCPQRAGIWNGERDGSRAYLRLRTFFDTSVFARLRDVGSNKIRIRSCFTSGCFIPGHYKETKSAPALRLGVWLQKPTDTGEYAASLA
jgi:hypothetical protein